MKLILCSGSPRRRELITEMGLEFTIDKETSYVEDMAALVAKFESEAGGKCSGESGADSAGERSGGGAEGCSGGGAYGIPQKVCAELSLGKSLGFHRELLPDEILISADTLVSLGDKIFGKPHSEQEAFEMLRALSGKTHCVTTALTLRSREKTVSRLSNAYVTFAELTDEEIHHYIERYSPLDKAGAYGIQEWIGLVAGTSIHGSFYTIMGLDTAALYSSLKEF